MNPIPIFTIGYGARDIEVFTAVLQQYQIDYLIDVRSKPYSRYKPDFSKAALTQHLAAAGIRYLFMGDTLGGQPDDPTCYTDGKVDYDKCRQMDFFQRGIGRLQKAWQQQQRVALMCSEGKPEMCHRSKLIAAALVEKAIDVAHIDENDQLISQTDVMLRLHEGQPSLFDSSSPPPPPPPPPPDDLFFPNDADDMWPDEAFYEEQSTWDLPSSPPQLQIDPGAKPLALLKQIFGYDAFRPLQEDIIDNLLAEQDSLAIMPTGSGKSLCFQLPALLWPGLTVVVSPLISLMQDQVAQLQELGIAAVTLNSSLPYPVYNETISHIRAGRVKLLYVAPETLLRPEMMLLLEQVRVDCLTIDEAHCISEWGHDFRPEYRQLAAVRQRLPDTVCLAVTATATERVRQDIIQSLRINGDGQFLASFDRDNLFLAVEPKSDGLYQTMQFLDAHRGEAGIIYCATRRQVDTLSEQLAAHGWPVLPYHAGLDDGTRQQNQHRFIYEEGLVMVATVAFGMGINKSNVRFILHYDLPKNLESYYQQIGRAGRDGLRADCLLLFSYSDVQTINYFIQQEDPSQQIGSRTRLEAMLAFVETGQCRRRPLLAYFGETYAAESCDFCDNCLAEEQEQADLTIPAQKFLSCVKRTGELFGMTHIIDVLRGSRAKRVLQKGHDRLSTYDIGGEFSKKEWQYLARQFIQQGLLVQDAEYGSLKLTAAAYAVFKGEPVYGLLPERQPTPTTATVSADYDGELFNLLRTKRTELAQETAVPPYIIFSDRALVEMATYFPQSEASFGNMYGVGQAKVEKYAAQFLPIIHDYCADKGLEERAQVAVVSSPARRIASSAGGKSRMEEVVELFNQGQSVVDLMAVYNVKQSTIVSHLYKGYQAGLPLRASDELLELVTCTAELRQQALAAFTEHGPDFLRPIFDALKEQVSFDDLHLLRLHFVCRLPDNG